MGGRGEGGEGGERERGTKRERGRKRGRTVCNFYAFPRCTRYFYTNFNILLRGGECQKEKKTNAGDWHIVRLSRARNNKKGVYIKQKGLCTMMWFFSIYKKKMRKKLEKCVRREKLWGKS